MQSNNITRGLKVKKALGAQTSLAICEQVFKNY